MSLLAQAADDLALAYELMRASAQKMAAAGVTDLRDATERRAVDVGNLKYQCIMRADNQAADLQRIKG